MDSNPMVRFFVNICFKVMPAVRMTQRSKWTDRARKYLAQQELLATELATYKPFFALPNIPEEKYSLTYVVGYKDRRRRDKDNVEKALLDALVYAGILIDDKCSILPHSDGRIALGEEHDRVTLIIRDDIGSAKVAREEIVAEYKRALTPTCVGNGAEISGGLYG